MNAAVISISEGRAITSIENLSGKEVIVIPRRNTESSGRIENIVNPEKSAAYTLTTWWDIVKKPINLASDINLTKGEDEIIIIVGSHVIFKPIDIHSDKIKIHISENGQEVKLEEAK